MDLPKTALNLGTMEKIAAKKLPAIQPVASGLNIMLDHMPQIPTPEALPEVIGTTTIILVLRNQRR